MKRIPFALALLLAVFASSPSYAVAIIAGLDTGGALGHTFTLGSTTVVVTTTAAAPPGSLIVIMCSGGNLTWTGASDSAGNTYTGTAATSFVAPIASREFYTVATNNLALGGTITCTANSASGVKTAVAAAFSGIAATPLDAASVSQTATSATYTEGPTGTLAYPGGVNGEVLLGFIQANVAGPPTQDATFTDLGTFSSGAGTQNNGAYGYKIVSASTAITYAPTGVSSAYVGALGAYKGTGGGTAIVHSLSSMGAGK